VSSLWSRLGDVARVIARPFLSAQYFASAADGVEARVEDVRDETADTRTLVLRPPHGWRRHRAGQHVRVSLELEGRIATRMYAIASAEDRLDGCFAITVQACGRVSRALVALSPGARVMLGPPEGDFVFVQGAPGPVLFLSAGIGIAPVASMLRTLAARRAMPDAVHVHFAPTERDAIFGAELRALATSHPSYRVTIIATREQSRRLSQAYLGELVPDWRTRDAWVCVPPAFLDAVTASFATAGRETALRCERFVAAVLPAGGEGGMVTFGASRLIARADGHVPLLRVAEDAGLAPRHGCRMGICHSCTTTLVSGRLRDLRTGETYGEPGARVQICISAAAGDVELAL
jgi:ferredoxin-NADP reductase